MTALYAKTTALSIAEATMTAEKAKYKKAKKRVRVIENELEGDRDYIDYLTGLIDLCDKDIEALNKKIAEKKARIEDEKKRRAEVEKNLVKREVEWNKLNKEATTPPEEQR